MIFNGKKIKDITGMRSGKLVAVHPVNPENRFGDKNRKQILWECKCDCGNISIQRTSRILGQERKSCGCMSVHGKDGVRRGHKIDLIKARAKCGDIPYRYFKDIIRGAERRKLAITISIEYVSDLFIKQGGKCVLSGRPLVFGVTTNQETTASLDRINSSLGYVDGNVQWIHKKLNMIKKRKNDESFVVWCKWSWEILRDVAENNK